MPHPLFGVFGVELEYMIVDDATLAVAPIADDLLAAAQTATGQRELAEAHVGDVEFGAIAWSNELCLHVLEMKTAEPATSLAGLADRFLESVRGANELLARRSTRSSGTRASGPHSPGTRASGPPSPGPQASGPPSPHPPRLLGGAMHPWMDPAREMRLWPHDNSAIYNLFDRIFDCRGHGWANLQSVHLNLPFASASRPDDDFGRLHAAIRLLLPILPALSASSPFMDGVATGRLDNRLEVYRGNARRLPVVSGRVIPEPVFTEEAYHRAIYAPIDAAITPLDPEGLLDHTWVNARGAIARFDRGAIEIRVLDVQETPAADLAIVATIVEVLRALVNERWIDVAAQQRFEIDPLATLLLRSIDAADEAIVDDPAYLAAFGLGPEPLSAGSLWRHLVEQVPPAREFGRAIETILSDGPLARRLLRAAGPDPTHATLERVYRRLGECLVEGELFRGTGDRGVR